MNNTMGYFGMTVGCSGSGKTTSYIIPKILDAIHSNNSFVVTDAKNEILDYIGKDLLENHYHIINLNLRDFNSSVSWNPLSLPFEAYKKRDMDNCYYLLNSIAQSMFNQGNATESDPFWNISARDFFVGLAFALFEDATSPEQINLCSIYSMAMSIHDRFGGNSNYLNEYFSMKEDKQNYAVSCSYGTVKAPSETRSSIVSVFHQKIRMLTLNDRYNEILCNKSIDLTNLVKQKTAFIIQYEDEINESSFLANIFIGQLINLLINERAKGDKKYKEFFVFFEDFLLLSYFPDLSHMILSCKARKINLYFSVNNLALMSRIYGDEITNSLMDNCDELVFTSFKNRKSIDYIKMVLGEKYSICDIGPENSMIIEKQYKSNVVKKEYVSRKEFNKTSISIPSYERKKIEIFSVKDVVNKKREQKMNEMYKGEFDSKASIDDIIRRIDKKIEELEAETEAEERTETSIN